MIPEASPGRFAMGNLNKKRREFVPTTPIAQWVDTFRSVGKKIPLTAIARAIDRSSSNVKIQIFDKFGLDALSKMLQEIPQKFNFNEQQTEELAEAVAQTIEQRLKKGSRFKFMESLSGVWGTRILQEQERSPIKLFTGKEVIKIIGISQLTLTKLRRKFDLPFLLTEEQVRFLTKYVSTDKTF